MNKKEQRELKQRLTSRKFWLAVASFVSGLILAFGGNEEIANTVSGCILSGFSVLAYAIGEGISDGKNKKD